jgi:hypothetical protein
LYVPRVPGRPLNDEPLPILWTDGDKRWEVAEILEARVCYGGLWYMVQWKDYRLEPNKWVKHSEIFVKDTIDTYYCRYPLALLLEV